MQSLQLKIATSLKENNSETNRKVWAEYLVKNKIKLKSLIGLLHTDHPVNMHFSWVLGGLCEQNPKMISPIIAPLFSTREKIKIKNFDRSLAKMFSLCGIPKEIESEAIDQLFKWLTDPKISVSTKHYTMFALENVVKKYPDLKSEFKLVVEDQLTKNKPSFDKLAVKILKRI